MTTISVITPVFNLIAANRRETFRQTMESVACQSSCDVEHVIADGNSSDGTQEFISDAIAGRSNVHFVSKADRNIYGGKNNGVSASSGDYLIFVNSDDFLSGPEVISRLVQSAEADGPDLIYGPVALMGENGGRIRTAEPDLKVFLRRMPFSTQGALIRRSVFDALGGFDEQFAVMSDYDFFLRLLMQFTHLKRFDSVISVFREGGISADYGARRAELLAIWKKNYSPFLGDTEIDYERIESRRRFPIVLLRAMLRSPDSNAITRKAIRHEMGRTLRRMFIL